MCHDTISDTVPNNTVEGVPVDQLRYNDCPDNCSCVSTTIMCHDTIPDTVPNNTVEGVPVDQSRYNDCPDNCSCVSTTITCSNTIPDTVPNNTVEGVPVDQSRNNDCPDNCSCVSTTIMCHDTISDTVPNNTVEGVPVDQLRYNDCPDNCSCVSTTIMCHDTIPDTVPNNTVEGVPVDQSRYNDCPDNCSCVSTTIKCHKTIPDTVPNHTVEVVLVDLGESELTPKRFCNVTWNNVSKLSLLFYRWVGYLYDHVFNCLDQIDLMRISGHWMSFAEQLFVFDGLTYVEDLDLSDSYIHEYRLKNLFSASSIMPSLRQLNLSMNRESLFVDQAFIDSLSSRPLEMLDISHNDHLTFDFRNSNELCTTLTSIILHDTPTTVIHLPKFCPSLQYVDLSGNQELTSGLKKCVQSYTYIKFNRFYFARVMHLNRLITDQKGYHTSDCHVFITPDDYNMAGKTLIELHFSDNYITQFEILFNLLYVGNSLELINLSHNRIKYINKNAFVFLRSLKKIDLSYNQLGQMSDHKSIFEALFRANQNLSSIDLSSNGLSYLPDETFLSNLNLAEIGLSRNAFSQLSLNVSYLNDLSVLDLRFNEINYLDSRSRQMINLWYANNNLRNHIGTKNATLHILLEGNPFTCRCEALDFLEWFVSSPIVDFSYTCVIDGRRIPMTELAVQAAREECEIPKRRRRTILLSTVLPGIALAAIIAVIIAGYRRYKRRRAQRLLDDKLRLIQEELTRYPYTVFLSYSSDDVEFVRQHIRPQMEVSYFAIVLHEFQCL